MTISNKIQITAAMQAAGWGRHSEPDYTDTENVMLDWSAIATDYAGKRWIIVGQDNGQIDVFHHEVGEKMSLFNTYYDVDVALDAICLTRPSHSDLPTIKITEEMARSGWTELAAGEAWSSDAVSGIQFTNRHGLKSQIVLDKTGDELCYIWFYMSHTIGETDRGTVGSLGHDKWEHLVPLAENRHMSQYMAAK